MKKALIPLVLLSALLLSGCGDPARTSSLLPITTNKNDNIQVSKELETCVTEADYREDVRNQELDLYLKKNTI